MMIVVRAAEQKDFETFDNGSRDDGKSIDE